jgi:hypothetical protein
VRGLRDGGRLGGDGLQELVADTQLRLVDAASHAQADARGDVRRRARLDRRDQRVDGDHGARLRPRPGAARNRTLSSGPGAGLVAAADARAADWLVAGVRCFDYTVGSIVPTGFEAYARIFHPARSGVGAEQVAVRWSEVAAANDRVMHAVAEWGSLTADWREPRRLAEMWDEEPRTGSLDADLAGPLGEVLAAHTTTPEQCWFALWEGYGNVLGRLFLFSEGTEPEEVAAVERAAEEADAASAARRAQAPRFELPDRPMLMFTGPLTAIADPAVLEPFGVSNQLPNIWWPDDRAWCVGTEVDLMTTYVGGTAACVEAICAASAVEALPASVDQLVTWDSDVVNPLPAPPR